MQCNYEIEVKEPETNGKLFQPFVRFRIVQLNLTPDCVTEGEIDYQADILIKKVDELRNTAKNKLNAAQSRHDKIVSDRRKN